jgi:hypothetical protein
MVGAIQNVTQDPSAFPFHGSLSCLQMYTAALNPAQIQFKSNCTDAATYLKTPCPDKYTYYDGICIGVKK